MSRKAHHAHRGKRRMSTRRGARPKRQARRAVVEAEALRFAAGWRLVAPAGDANGAPPEPSLHVDVIRAADLVALSVDAFDCELVAGGEAPPVLRPLPSKKARLVVTYPYQHLAEAAIYEGRAPSDSPVLVPGSLPGDAGKPVPDTAPADGPDARPHPPVNVRPARSSRLVFAVPDDESIEFSSAGILTAMQRLELVVHPLALPGDRPTTGSLGDVPFVFLPGGLVAYLAAAGPVIAKAARGMHAPDTATSEGLALQARELRRARLALEAQTGVSVARALPHDAQSIVPDLTIGGSQFAARPIFGAGGLVAEPMFHPRPRAKLSRRPTAGETSIEAPFRLVISPSGEGRWAHATEPVCADDEPYHVELWHSRLGTAKQNPDGTQGVDEQNDQRRIVRAVWARDRETSAEDWHDSKKNLGHINDPFRTSLDPADRNMLVRQTAETWLGSHGTPIRPVPVAARHLWLSGLGAWLDLHGAWTTKPYSRVGMTSILAWDEIAPMGRDQYVRVVYPGYLYPFGHQAALVKLTERKMKDVSPSVASLYQRKFLVLGEPVRSYSDAHDFPFIQVGIRPLVTPTLDDPGTAQDRFFWPQVGGQFFGFTIDALDHESRPVRLVAPLLWVAESYLQFGKVDTEYDTSPNRRIPAFGQKVAFAPVHKGGDTVLEVESISLRGKATLGDSRPHMSQAKVSLPAVQQLSGIGAVPIVYHSLYRSGGFASPSNTGEIWAAIPLEESQRELKNSDDLVPLPQLKFGAGAPSGSDKAGGFLSPDLPIRGLSRASGTVGDLAGMAKKQFDPKEFLKGALPKLFGIVDIVDLVEAVTGEPLKIPSVVSESLDRIEGLLTDLGRAKATAQNAVDEANKLVARAAAKTAQLQNEAQAALVQATAVKTTVTKAVDDFVALIGTLQNKDKATVEAAVAAELVALRAAVTALQQLGPKLPPFIRNELATLTKVLQEVLAAVDLVEDLYRFLNGFDPSGVQARFRFEWRPKLASWPAGPDPILKVQPDSLLLAVDGRASGKGEMGLEVLAEIRDFELDLVGSEKLVRIAFDHLSFKAGSSGKADVDVVIQKNEFVGILAFVEAIKNLIPFDGFSDPPYLEVDSQGLTAGFTLALPNLSIGVFTLANISLGADVQVPFLGKTTSVGFNFCTREHPFTLAVVFLGGGGWFGIRIGPDKLQVLELGLEAGACLAIDLGVASGSISAMIGIYIRLESDKGSLTGYFRLRGEVDVLGLISASIELYLALLYEFDTGKMCGQATITVQIKVFVFSGSVQIHAERKFAGSNGDPSFLQVMGAETGLSPAWSEYCNAFAAAA
jgi:hypothetical protein